MTKYFVVLIFGAVIGLSVGKSYSIAAAEISPIPLSQYIRHKGTLAISRLHYLTIGEIDALKNSMARDIALDAIGAYEMLGLVDLDQNERDALERFLILLAVMDEKMDIGEWDKDEELVKILTSVRIDHRERADKLRCLNWDKPMWADRGSCA